MSSIQQQARRAGIASELIQQTLGVFLVLVLYSLFKAVHEMRAKEMVVLGALVSVPIIFWLLIWGARTRATDGRVAP